MPKFAIHFLLMKIRSEKREEKRKKKRRWKVSGAQVRDLARLIENKKEKTKK